MTTVWSSSSCNVKFEQYLHLIQDSDSGFKIRIQAERVCATSMLRFQKLKNVYVMMYDHLGHERKASYHSALWSKKKRRLILSDPLLADESCFFKPKILTIDLEESLIRAPGNIYSPLKSSFKSISCGTKNREVASRQ